MTNKKVWKYCKVHQMYFVSFLLPWEVCTHVTYMHFLVHTQNGFTCFNFSYLSDISSRTIRVFSVNLLVIYSWLNLGQMPGDHLQDLRMDITLKNNTWAYDFHVVHLA